MNQTEEIAQLRARVQELEQQLARDHRDWAERYAELGKEEERI